MEALPSSVAGGAVDNEALRAVLSGRPVLKAGALGFGFAVVVCCRLLASACLPVTKFERRLNVDRTGVRPFEPSIASVSAVDEEADVCNFADTWDGLTAIGLMSASVSLSTAGLIQEADLVLATGKAPGALEECLLATGATCPVGFV